MSLDVGVLDDDYKYMRQLHIDRSIYGLLFKKIVTTANYPSLGKAENDTEDITFTPEDIPALIKDIEKLDNYLDKESIMSDEVKGRCRNFTATLKEICETALKHGKNVEFIAGD